MATKADPLSYLNFWEEAAAQEIGICVECPSEDDQKLLVNALYECRRAVGRFEELMISQPQRTVFFIHKKMTEMD